jgi:hypothetical protein
MISNKTRVLAIVTGCLVSIAALIADGWRYAVAVSGLLVLGAILQPQLRRWGRALMWAGTLWLSFWVLYVGFGMLAERTPGAPVRIFDILEGSAVLLALACDGAMLTEEIRIWRA